MTWLFFPCDVDQLDAIEEEHLTRLRPELNSEGVRKPFRPVRRHFNARGVWLLPQSA